MTESAGRRDADRLPTGHEMVFVCERVLTGVAPIASVVHDEDGDWQFLCANEHSEPGDGDGPKIVGAAHVLELDPNLAGLPRLERGGRAERAAPGAPWTT